MLDFRASRGANGHHGPNGPVVQGKLNLDNLI